MQLPAVIIDTIGIGKEMKQRSILNKLGARAKLREEEKREVASTDL
jgi:hypothetical protein